MTTAPTVRRHQTVGDLASTHPGASRVFHRHGLDFCCGGAVTLEDACAAAHLDVERVIDEIGAEDARGGDLQPWGERPLGELIDHVLERYHAGHRAEVPRLLEMARKVERVHAGKASCPRGLADHLARMEEELELHMQKEEHVLFPLVRQGHGRAAAMPIHVMEEEHQDHGRNLERLGELTGDFRPPAEACGTWRALYLGLAELRRELMDHIHLENHVLFPRALRG